MSVKKRFIFISEGLNAKGRENFKKLQLMKAVEIRLLSMQYLQEAERYVPMFRYKYSGL